VEIYRRLLQCQEENRSVVLATVIKARGSVPRHEGTKMLIYPNGATYGTIGGGPLEELVIQEAQKALGQSKTSILHYNFVDPERGDPGVCGGEMDIFLEAIHPQPTVIVFGLGHVGKAVVHLAHWCGFRVIAADDRRELARSENFPEADLTICCEPSEISKKMQINHQTYIVLTTRGVPVDAEGLPSLLETPAAYIGVIGSKRRWETTVQQMREMGIKDEQIARITSPIGLEINAETPEEIAISILSEMIMIRRQGTGERMTHRPHKLSKSQGE
jgi:xanthine dehydrogenase accessory factor